MRLAAAAEGALLLAALPLGRWWDAPPFARLEMNWGALAVGIAATAPLLIGLRWSLTTRWPPAERFVRLVEERVGPLVAGAGPGSLALVALMAGVAEEALFRGVIQMSLLGRVPAAAALGITAVIFGVAHWVSAVYAVLACLVGLYLGVLFQTSGNLLVPITTHALYDFIALLILARVKPDPTRLVWGTGPE